MGDVVDPGRGARTRARRQARVAAAKQKKLIKQQRQKEALELAEKEDELARKRALINRPGGRSLLIATSPKGVQNLGGIANA